MLRYFLSPLCLIICLPVIATASTTLIHSSVKLRVDSANGHAWGTGTIIDTRQGPEGQEALILTCGHIFRGWHEEKNIEVHLYGENSTVKVLGKCLVYDLEIDLALVRIGTPSLVRAVPIAPPSYQIQPSQPAWSVGCDHGGNPTVRQHQVMSVDKISQSGSPFHYVQVSGAPVGGRSGGGLFSSEGYLIGVCVTACPSVNDGHFVPPHMIRHVLDKVGLAHIHQNPSLGVDIASARAGGISPPVGAPLTGGLPPPAHALTALAPLTPLASLDAPSLPMAAASTPAPMYAAEHQGGMSREEQATLEEIERRKQDGDEVILIVRSTRNPGIPSDVIVLNGVSDQFLDALVRSPVQPGNSGYNPVIFSSHEAEQPVPVRQPVSFPVQY